MMVSRFFIVIVDDVASMTYTFIQNDMTRLWPVDSTTGRNLASRFASQVPGESTLSVEYRPIDRRVN
jgi:hypothetical protein